MDVQQTGNHLLVCNKHFINILDKRSKRSSLCACLTSCNVCPTVHDVVKLALSRDIDDISGALDFRCAQFSLRRQVTVHTYNNSLPVHFISIAPFSPSFSHSSSGLPCCAETLLTTVLPFNLNSPNGNQNILSKTGN